ncbi:MAG: phospholipid carrier-dependent glycosyltransferase [Chloroflexi bacterium]|nr:phospholipid carrier-dependent glycosyltransferase [Chloroflexota bacterium]
MTKPPYASFLTLVLLALSGTFLILYATPQGMGLFDDSIAYIAGARSILAGQGYREAWLASNQPVTHFPPGFSSVLALVGISGLDPLRGARFVNSILFGASIFLLGLIGWRMTKSKVAGIVLALLFLVNGQLFRVHTTAMSEPLYIFFTLAAFLSFWRYFYLEERSELTAKSAKDAKKKKNLSALSGLRGSNVFLVLSAVFTAFAYLTRYAGLALLATFLVSLFILHDTWRKRFISAGIFLAGFLPFAIAWGIRNRLLADNATNRTLVYHPITAENVQLGISNFTTFLLPVEEWRRVLIKIPNLFTAILIIFILALLVWVVFKGLKKFFQPATETPEVLSFISTLYFFGYLSSIISSMTLFDASTKFQLRIVAPMYVSLLIMLVYLGWLLWSRQKAITILLSLAIFSLSLYGFTDTLAQLRKGGQGYASFQWFDSEAMDFLQTLPEGTRIYSNETAPVYLYTNRPGYVLPDLIDPVTGLPRGRFDEGVADLQADVLSGEAALALFDVDSRDEDVQSVYRTLTDGLYLAFDKQGDKIYTAYP